MVTQRGETAVSSLYSIQHQHLKKGKGSHLGGTDAGIASDYSLA